MVVRPSFRPPQSVRRPVAALLLGAASLLLGQVAGADAPEGALRSALPRAALAQGRFARLEPVEHAGKTYYPYSFDGHVHTHHSPDAYNPPPEVLEEAERGGLSAVVITDHGSPRAKLDFRGYKGRVLPFVGQEIGGPFGHAVFWNVELKQEVVPSATSLAQRAAFAHDHGGLIVLCHPGWWIHGREEDPMKWIAPEALQKGGVSGDIDALELWNGMYDKPLRRLITAWEAALEAGAYVPIVGNSDFHRLGAHRVGGPRNLVYCEQPAPERCLWDTVKAGRLVVTDGPSLMMSVNGAPLGSVAHAAAGSSLRVAVTSASPQGGELRLFLGRALVYTRKLGPHEPVDETWQLVAPSQSSYVRAEIVKPAVGEASEQVLLLSNAIRLQR